MKNNPIFVVGLIILLLASIGCTGPSETEPTDDEIKEKIRKTCEENTDETKKLNCYANNACFKKDHSLCDFLSTQQEKDMCRKDVAVCLEDSSICNGIQDQTLKNNCITEHT